MFRKWAFGIFPSRLKIFGTKVEKHLEVLQNLFEQTKYYSAPPQR